MGMFSVLDYGMFSVPSAVLGSFVSIRVNSDADLTRAGSDPCSQALYTMFKYLVCIALALFLPESNGCRGFISDKEEGQPLADFSEQPMVVPPPYQRSQPWLRQQLS
ncbi:hypothetical protein Tco_1013745 [Tanacetum coccineum]